MKWIALGGMMTIVAVAVIFASRSDSDDVLATAAAPKISVVTPAAAHPIASAPASEAVVSPPSPTPSPTSSPSPTPTANPPSEEDLTRLSGIMKAFSRHDAMLKKLQTEPRDPVWAPRSEALLTDRYRAMPHIGGTGRILSIHCGSTLCMVAGDLPSGAQPDAERQARDALHSFDMVKDLWAQGYGGGGSAYGPSASDNRNMFVTFYERTAPRKFRS